VRLRATSLADVPIFLRHLNEPGARWMAAFGPRGQPDLPAFRARWANLLSQPGHRFRTVLVRGRVAGYIGRFPFLDGPTVAYWYGRRFWGGGVATEGLRRFLRTEQTRPLFARVAHDNVGSRRVLEKCGFVVVGRSRALAPARGRRLTELILRSGGAPERSRRSRIRRPRRARPHRSGSHAA
jgi:RimJ/RimL family protein N-acetyltransferase